MPPAEVNAQALARAGGELFRETLRVAASAGSRNCLAAEFARFVLDTEPVDVFNFGRRPRPEREQPDEAWFERMHADAGVRAAECETQLAVEPWSHGLQIAERP